MYTKIREERCAEYKSPGMDNYRRRWRPVRVSSPCLSVVTFPLSEGLLSMFEKPEIACNARQEIGKKDKIARKRYSVWYSVFQAWREARMCLSIRVPVLATGQGRLGIPSEAASAFPSSGVTSRHFARHSIKIPLRCPPQFNVRSPPATHPISPSISSITISSTIFTPEWNGLKMVARTAMAPPRSRPPHIRQGRLCWPDGVRGVEMVFSVLPSLS